MKPALILVGGGGSHPATIALVARSIRALEPDRGVVVVDLSAFDARANASYDGVDGEVLRVLPAEFGLPRWFKTAAPNMALAGGMRKFARMVSRFEDILRSRNAAAVLICHNHGFPEQAMIAACAGTATPLAQIDEGPFSGMVLGPRRKRPTSLGERVLTRLGLLPTRNLTGNTHALLLPTSPARARTLLERGLPPEKIVPVAAPRFDTLPGVMERWKARRPDAHGRTRVLILHQPFGRDAKVDAGAAERAERTMIEGLRIVARDHALSVTLRPHPRSDAAEIARLESLLSPFDESSIAMSVPLHAQMEAHDMALGFYSSALLEAAAVGLPTVSVLIPRHAFARSSEADKAHRMPALGIPIASAPGELAELLARAVTTDPAPPPEALFDEALGLIDGKASEKVARSLIALADGRHLEGTLASHGRAPADPAAAPRGRYGLSGGRADC